MPERVGRQYFLERGLGMALGAPNYTHTDGGLVLSCPSCLLTLARVALRASL